ncbi:GNAT family N-acetyltransferase [Staphylococcus debuckii]|uniref:GNAT family N-acetyltransferase n=1 Tax=Staphylococcus debuckii TaxID=2044912 RepID=UPI000F4389AD|nr:GNAT family N-acetyltransferase [Staphylococcus debuckii]AYU55713.1 GNAT family N-acetyltransferase [Staphylococcus debuckii]
MKIVRVTTDDIKELQTISFRTFDDTFREMNHPDKLKDYLNNAFTYDKLQREVEHPNSYFYFLYDNDKIVGYLKLNVGAAQTEDIASDALEVERLYILKNYQHHGYGKKLMNFAINFAVEEGKQSIWLGVWEKNENAIKFYEHFGYKKVTEHEFKMGDEIQTDIIMAQNLK